MVLPRESAKICVILEFPDRTGSFFALKEANASPSLCRQYMRAILRISHKDIKKEGTIEGSVPHNKGPFYWESYRQMIITNRKGRNMVSNQATYAESDFETCKKSDTLSLLASSSSKHSLAGKSTRESLLYRCSPVT